MSISNLHIIVGLGATGISCARYFKDRGIPFAVTDTRLHPPYLTALEAIAPDVQTSFGQLDISLLEKAAKIILSPGIALHEPVIAQQSKRGVPIVGDIELFAQAVNVPVIAITGTNAKSTVTTLVGKMAAEAGYQVQIGGNLGVPALELLMQHPKSDLFVLELSSFQLETTSSLKPHVATILNVTPDHMDRYQNMLEYQQAKYRVYRHCRIAVCNRDDPRTECHDSLLLNKFYFTLNRPKQNEFGLIEQGGKTYLAFENQILLATGELPVMGKHYHANVLAALAVSYGLGAPIDTMLSVLKEFKGLPHRCQFVRERHGVKWYNDSKGTNVGATQAALLGLGSEITGKLVWIAGGVGKNADFSVLAPSIQKYIRHAVLIGEAAQDIAGAIGNKISISFANSMNEAVQQAAGAALLNDSVLLSPACASFDMFKNYEHRGEVFMEVVNQLN